MARDALKENTVYCGDCMELGPRIARGSVDLILSDPPYGLFPEKKLGDYKNFSAIKWDRAIEPSKLYELAYRMLRPSGRALFFAQEPYTSQLITEANYNIEFNYRLIWKKPHFGNVLQVNQCPVSYCEDIVVLSKCRYDTELAHPLRDYFRRVRDHIGLGVGEINKALGHRGLDHTMRWNTTQFYLCSASRYKELVDRFDLTTMEGYREYEALKETDRAFWKQIRAVFNLRDGKKYKGNVLEYKRDYPSQHPTQKPVALLEDLIETFSDPGDLVVDLTAGSGSTGVACRNTQRRFIMIEQDAGYCAVAERRIAKEGVQVSMLV